jgi:two-component sensor histidine kinase
MKGVPVLKKIFYSSFFLAAVPAILIILLLSPFATTSRLKVEQVIKSSSRCVYADLNSDSVSEVMLTGKGAPYFFILIMNNDMKVYDQWNLQDSMDLDMSDFFIGNYDHDRYKEIYVFTYKDDSLFLNINEFFDPKGTKLDRLYITKIRVVNNKVTSIIRPAGFFDTNGDGKDELFFSIQTGFGVEPRRLYSYDIVNRELKTSQLTGEICQFPKMVDADGDGRPEIFGLMGASGNSKTWYPFTDWSTWLMVFNDSLKFKFPPVEFPGLTNHLDIYSYKNEDLRGYVVAHNTGSADTTVMKPRIMFYSLDGKKIRERLFSEFGINTFTRLVVMKNRDKDRIYLFGKEFLELNDQFEIIKRVKSPFNYQYDNSYIEDMDFDGENELIFYSSNDEKLAVYSADLRKIAEAKLKGTFEPFRFSHYSSRDHVNKLFMNANGGYGYFLTLKGNIYYYLGYLAYPGIYLLFFFFIVLIKRINTLQVVQKESLNRRLVTLQLQGIKSQLDPHFTFNTLNSIASLIYLDDRQLAYDYMNKFTQLLRGLINDADRIYRSLGEEIEFVTTYLDLEKLRFGDKFNYEIVISEHVSQREQVPKLVLHTFAENAIKHGIMSLEDGGILKIGVVKNKDYLILSVEDNGVGRAKAEGQGTSTGKGLRLTREFYDILNQLNKMPIRHTIIDLYNEKGDSVGTRVEVWVPVELEQDKR